MKNGSADTGRNWKIILWLLFGVFLAAMAASLFIAQRRVSRVVDRDYYSRGLRYGEGAGSAGWTMTPVASGNDLQVRLKDRSGAPVTGGELTFQQDGAGAAPVFSLREIAPGVYSAPLPGGGRQDVRGSLRFSRGTAVIVGKVALFK